jgi:hypothetical protein
VIVSNYGPETTVACEEVLTKIEGCRWEESIDIGIHRTTKLRRAMDEWLVTLPDDEYLTSEGRLRQDEVV